MRKTMRTRAGARLSAVAGLCLGVASTALAHPGHGISSSSSGLLHFLLETSHGGGIAILGAAGIFTITLMGIAKVRRSARE
jgi:hypothetical protein